MVVRLLFASGLVLVISLFASTRAAEPDKTELAQKAAAILKTNCYRCHGGDNVCGGFDYVLNQPRLIEGKKVVPGNPKDSKLYKKLIDGTMPPAEDGKGKPVTQRPNQGEIAIIKEAGAPDLKK